MIGRVVSIKMQNTVVVLVESTKTHPLYKKTYRRSKKYLVDDLLNTQIGQIVEIVPTKPISKRKYWKVTKVVGRDIEAVVDEQLKAEATEAIEDVMPEIHEPAGKIVKEEVEDETETKEKTVKGKRKEKSS
jgi:small subunit ribosomal protein S17